ncbi:aldo/keto reductase, partial [Rhizobium leguminosarum]|uniref:aldo/keto reductase n=1 Tax=Rhizobium leguminosarum TaxID=384 RepID=UPI003F9C9207
PAVSLGLWHNFGGDTPHDRKIDMFRTAFDLGITHFDLANNYGPPPGSAETAFGEIMRSEFFGLRDELIISSKAGYDMWPGPYGECSPSSGNGFAPRGCLRECRRDISST